MPQSGLCCALGPQNLPAGAPTMARHPDLQPYHARPAFALVPAPSQRTWGRGLVEQLITPNLLLFLFLFFRGCFLVASYSPIDDFAILVQHGTHFVPITYSYAKKNICLEKLFCLCRTSLFGTFLLVLMVCVRVDELWVVGLRRVLCLSLVQLWAGLGLGVLVCLSGGGLYGLEHALFTDHSW